MISPVTFKANLISNTTVLKNDELNNIKEQVPVSFVELNPLSTKDFNAMRRVSAGWYLQQYYADVLVDNMRDCYNKGFSVKSEHYYALTLQKNNFDNLDPDKVLGVVQIHNKDDSTEIDLLQTDPNYISRFNPQKYKYIGTGILNSLKDLLPGKDLTLDAAPGAIPFYEKNGFRTLHSETNRMIYRAPSIKKKIKTLSFKANFINNSTVKKINNIGTTIDKKVSFVELNPFNKNDVNAILKVAKMWKKKDEFAKGIAKSMYTCFDGGMRIPEERYFALTEQIDNFQELDSDKILGLLETSNFFSELQVDYLQTNPLHMNKSKKRGFTHIGTGIMNSLKQMFPDNGIFLNASEEAIPFYKKNGFELLDKNTRAMVYDPLDIKG